MTMDDTVHGDRRSVLVAARRTPIGRFLGGLGGLSAVQLGTVALRAVLEDAPVADRVDAVLMGQVLQAGCGQLPARQAAAAAGVAMSVPATTINQVCLSGLVAVAWADRLIRLGEAEVVLAGGMESMSQAPRLLTGSRTGTPYGDQTLLDHVSHDGLWDAFTDQPMGRLTESCNVGAAAIDRSRQDAFALRSHQRAAAAARDGVLAAELVAVQVPQRRGDPIVVDADEGVRGDGSLDALARLRPAFTEDGTITAGSSSPLSDGAAALCVMSAAAAEAAGLTPLAEIVSAASVAGPDSSLQLQPARAIRSACDRAGIAVGELARIEINEAFAAVALASADALGLDPEQIDRVVDVHGGAIALGHPIGASGARLAAHLAHTLAPGELGVAALCGGGGQGEAMVLCGLPH